MSALVGISIWVTLATVIPGLVTIATVYGAFVVVAPSAFDAYLQASQGTSEWVWLTAAVTVMVLTQAVGILLEEVLVRNRWLGSETVDLTLKAEGNPEGRERVVLERYEEYGSLYILLAQLREDEDAQGHLKRALAQFFLTNNTLVSFAAGIVATAVLMALSPTASALARGGSYVGVLLVCLLVSYLVAVIRFDVMTKSLWATRTARSSR